MVLLFLPHEVLESQLTQKKVTKKRIVIKDIPWKFHDMSET